MKTDINANAKRCVQIAYEFSNAGKKRECLRASFAALILNPSANEKKGLVKLILLSIFGKSTINLLQKVKILRKEKTSILNEIRQEIQKEPLSPDLHFKLAAAFLEENDLISAYACCKTAMAIAELQGRPTQENADLIINISKQLHLDDNEYLKNQHFFSTGDPFGRMRFLTKEMDLSIHSPCRILDVGGGNGFLSLLLKDNNYILIEPDLNGMNGIHMPFEDHTFDYVISSHTLEHINGKDRKNFIDELVRLTGNQLFILGPFYPQNGKPLPETVIFGITEAAWAKEHLDYGLPILSEICDMLKSANLSLEVVPNADERIMYWQYIALHFAEQAGESDSFTAFSDFFNANFDYKPLNTKEPHDFLIKSKRTS